MLFNSFEFALFLPLIFVAYWYLCGRHWRIQNVVLLAGSLVFYGWWDPRFLGLMLFSAVLDFTVGNLIYRARSVAARRGLLGISIGVNFGILGVFKYYNFFAESLNEALGACGIGPAAARLDLLLPVGISFYTFQTVSSSIDIYRGTLTPTRDLVAYLSFVTFFPQLVAGPIERAGHLLPQFLRRREFRLADAFERLPSGVVGVVQEGGDCG
ncbi:MAG UNVERIFIED_CONTAM: hypothetical protein LVR18_17915 [Planctomycetaceae bacterium]|jgi:D-alanyl-lipoteichoic acid acyltransferase DltB (MBOAT superfamily)